jgi:chemotaxis response regulator CheB
VEDDPTVRADLRLALEDAGYDVADADGGQALELVRELEPDVVVLGRADAAVTPRAIGAERRVPIVEVPRPCSSSQVVEAVTGALVAHRERAIRDTRTESLRSIENLVEHLSFATPPPTDLEQKAWNRGHVWRRVDTDELGAA